MRRMASLNRDASSDGGCDDSELIVFKPPATSV